MRDPGNEVGVVHVFDLKISFLFPWCQCSPYSSFSIWFLNYGRVFGGFNKLNVLCL